MLPARSVCAPGSEAAFKDKAKRHDRDRGSMEASQNQSPYERASTEPPPLRKAREIHTGNFETARENRDAKKISADFRKSVSSSIV